MEKNRLIIAAEKSILRADEAVADVRKSVKDNELLEAYVYLQTRLLAYQTLVEKFKMAVLRHA